MDKVEPVRDRVLRKGPAAGTGYEGFGAFGKASRGRSGSVSNSNVNGDSRSRSGSQTSTTESVRRDRSGSRPGSRNSGMEVEMDDYFMDRLKPVVISGGGVVHNQNKSSELSSGSPGPADMLRTESTESNNSARSGSSLAPFRRELSPASSARETVAHRRAGAAGRAVTPIPPINTSGQRLQPTPSPVSSHSSSRKPSLDAVATPTTATLPPKSKRWNFFQRSHTQKVVATVVAAASEPPPSAPANFSIPRRNSPAQPVDKKDSAELLRTATPAAHPVAHGLRKQQTIYFQKPTKTPSPNPQDDAERTRERVRREKANERKMLQHQPTERKLVRPALPRLQTEQPIARTRQEWTAPPRAVGTAPSGKEFQVKWDSYGLTPVHAPKQSMDFDPLDVNGHRGNEIATPLTSFMVEDWPTEAVMSPIEDVGLEEEIWDEYDDLEGMFGASAHAHAHLAPAPPPKPKRTNTVLSTTSSLGAPFKYDDITTTYPTVKIDSPKIVEETLAKEEAEATTKPAPRDSPTLRPVAAKDMPDNIPTIQLEFPRSSLGPREMLPLTPPAQRVTTPATPFSLSSFIHGYGDRDSRVLSVLEPLSTTFSTPAKTHKTTPSNASNETTSSNGSRNSQLQVDEMKVRPWALLASRWLTGDRILLSPAPTPSSNSRILVIDGLGTGKLPHLTSPPPIANDYIVDDWSFYLSLSFPTTKIYNLTPTPPTPQPPQTRPTNHKQVHHPSLTHAFPFPANFFTTITLRFPPSPFTSLLLSECRRVLAPGGHLELITLDADLLSAGPKTTGATELVKAIMSRETPGRKRPQEAASAKMLRGLEKKGFTGLRKCYIALPAVGKLESAGGEGREVREPSPEDPEAIAEVISKVGRWWYTRCYERVITAEGEGAYRSMWNDRGLVRECRKRGSGFRLLVACARKPAHGEKAGE